MYNLCSQFSNSNLIKVTYIHKWISVFWIKKVNLDIQISIFNNSIIFLVPLLFSYQKAINALA
jgi:hypothetical protein